MGIAPRNLGDFFDPWFKQGDALPPDVRCLLLGDSTFTTATAITQGSFGAAILTAFGVPQRADGRNPFVGLAGRGPIAGNERWAACSSGTTTAGWGSAVDRNPGATASNGATNVAPGPYSDFNMGSSGVRTQYGGDTTGAGVPLVVIAGRNISNAAIASSTDSGFGSFGSEPFSGVQCHATWITTGAGASRGLNDMRVQGIRGTSGSSLTNAASGWAANRTRYVGSKTTVDMTPDGGVLPWKVDCGAGAGLPGFFVANPDAADSMAARTILSTGWRICRTSGAGVPIDGLHIGGISTATYTIPNIRAAVGDDASPTFTQANFLNYLRAFIGKGTDGVNNGPTHIIIQCGYNFASAESTALASGDTSVYRDNIIGLIQYMKARCVTLNNAEPKILIFFCGAMHQNGFNRSVAVNGELAASQAALAEGCAYYSMFNATDTGVSSFASVQPWYTRGASVNNTASGDGTGPVATGDFLHPSLVGADALMRRLWSDAADDLDFEAWPNLATGLPMAAIRGGGGSRSRGRW
jgi:hypothetical protein